MRYGAWLTEETGRQGGRGREAGRQGGHGGLKPRKARVDLGNERLEYGQVIVQSNSTILIYSLLHTPYIRFARASSAHAMGHDAKCMSIRSMEYGRSTDGVHTKTYIGHAV